MIHLVTTWDTESPCRALFGRQVCFHRDWVEATERVMATCEAYRVPATFMVNAGEIDYWHKERPSGEAVVQTMVRRGHDVQLHLHPAWALWWCDGRDPYYDPESDPTDDGLRRFAAGGPEEPWTQRFFLRQGLDRLEKITGRRPTCYRDVNYDINDPRVFYSLWKEGVRSDWTLARGVFSSASQGLKLPADPLPNRVYFPDCVEVRRPARTIGWPVLEVPNTVNPATQHRFDFQTPLRQLIEGFDLWYLQVQRDPVAICSFLNHQKREIFDADRREPPYAPAGKNVLENMRGFFEAVQEKYITAGLPVTFSTARGATEACRAYLPAPAVVREIEQER